MLAIGRRLAVMGVLAVLAGCGGSGGASGGGAPRTAGAAGGGGSATERRAAGSADASGTAPRTIVFFRRYRYAGATVAKVAVRRDGRVAVDRPTGNAGRRSSEGRLSARALRGVRGALADVPWGALSRRRVRLDGSGGYYLITAGRHRVTAVASGMSADLVPLVRRLNRVLDSPANSPTFRFFTAG